MQAEAVEAYEAAKKSRPKTVSLQLLLVFILLQQCLLLLFIFINHC
jgi:hypothetical protein